MSGRPASLRAERAEYLALRRALGFGLRNAGRLLGQYVGFMEDHHMDTVTTDNALSWASLPADVSPIWLAVRMSAVRGFATYLHSMGTADQVPPTGLVRSGPCRATPYLYSAADVEALVAAAGALRPRLRAATYQTLIGLLAVSGARVGEVIALDDSDLDRERALLSVRNTKFNKSRLVPLHATALRALEVYTGLRDELRRRPESPALFVSTAGTRLHHSNVGLTFSQLASQAGLTRRSASCRPRIHDMRHSFAVASLVGAYASGADVPAMMPLLATFLGHSDPKHTYWYLSSAPELMALAGKRLEMRKGDRP